MKHVTFFIASLSSGGAEHQLVTLAGFLKDRGYPVTIVNYSDTPDHYVVPSGVDIVKLGKGRSSVRKVLAIISYFLRIKTDVVISFGQRDNFFCLIPLLLRRKIQIIAGERNFTVGGSDFYEKWLLRILYKRASYIVPNSHSQREYLLKKNPQWKDKIITITNYTDVLEYASKDNHRTDSDKLTFAIFSRLVPQKNCLTFAKVVRRLKDRFGSHLVFSWYGNMTPKGESNILYLRRLQADINTLGIEDMFILNDHIHDVARIMSIYDAICLPSLKEGFSNTISEAICIGKPVLASDVSDNKYMVHDGENGYLFDPLSVDNMVEVISRFYLLSEEERLHMGQKSREIAENLFQKDIFVNSYINLIEGK